jgi:hypothetical protein
MRPATTAAFPRRLLGPAFLLAVLAAVLLIGPGVALSQSAPTVTAVAVTSDAGSDDTYFLGDTIRVTVTFSEAVDVTGAPQLAIDMDPAEWGTKWAAYESGSGSASLVFAHTVVEPNYSTRGIAVIEDTLRLNGGAIQSAADVDASLAHDGLAHDAEHKVNWRLTAATPTVTAVAVTSDAGDDDTYVLGDTIFVTVSFSDAVNVSGTPQLAIDMDPAEWGTKWAAYQSGSGSTVIVFAHTVVEPNFSSQGVAVLADTLRLNGGTITSRASSQTNANLGHDGLAHDANHKVNWRIDSNQAPVANTDSAGYASFTLRGNAPRGVMVSKPFYGVFSDPDDDQLTYSVSVSDNHRQLLDNLYVTLDKDHRKPGSSAPAGAFDRVFFMADADDDWDAIRPALPEDQFPVTVTLTATDPGGLSASVSADFLVSWRSTCELAAPSSVEALTIGKGAVVSWTLPQGRSDACEVSGFVVGATGVGDNEGLGLEELITDPDARTHTLRGLDPGGYIFSVRIDYAEGSSEDLRTSEANAVPNACITLAAKPYSRNAISGKITSVNGTGCEARATFTLEFKRTSDNHWSEYGQLPWSLVRPDSKPSPLQPWAVVDPNHANLPDFIMGGIDPYVGYDIRISAYDASESKYSTSPQSVTIVSNGPTETADDNSPGDVRLYAHNHSDAWLSWALPTVASGRTLSAYVVQWKAEGDTTTSSSVIAKTTTASDFTRRQFNITGLTNGTFYTVRVAARTHPDGNTATTSDAWSVWAPAVLAWSEPTQIWWVENTPQYNSAINRVFMMVDSNKSNASAVCRLSATSTINCPPQTLVSLPATTDALEGKVVLTKLGTSTDGPPSEGEKNGPPAISKFYASGGAGQIVVAWGDPATGGTGTIDAFIIQHRSGTSGDWTETVLTDTTKRSHTISSLADGTWQVRIRARNDGNDGDPNTTDSAKLGFTSAIRTVTVKAANSAKPSGIEFHVTAGSGSLTVDWELPDSGSMPFAYEVRHRDPATTTTWTTSATQYPLPIQRYCKSPPAPCTNPRTFTIRNLTAGTAYNVEIRIQNANGWSKWWQKTVRPNN